MITTDTLTALERTLHLLEGLPCSGDASVPASPVAQALRDAWPGALLTACLLKERRQVAALDPGGQPHKEMQERLARPGSDDPESAWRNSLDGLGTALVVSDEGALLAVVLPPSASAEEVALARLGLASVLRLLALHALRRRAAALEEEAVALEPLANVGELAGVLSHESANFLHHLLLHVTILENRLPPSEREDVTAIRQQGNRFSELVNRFQEYPRTAAGPVPRSDLNAIVRQVADHLAQDTTELLPVRVVENPGAATPPSADCVTLLLERAASAARVRGRAADVRRLVRFLVRNSVRAAAGAGNRVAVTVESDAGGTRLRVEDSAPAPPSVDVETLFRSSSPREGAEGLELAACRSLARRLRCTLKAEGRPEGGLRLLVEFGPATEQ